ncbi:MAG: hypothetical protein JW814_10560 [Candidatus Krumholzibacteriota bacterium]|nr:hypothetical protein [Candidatus Krumholzibacteriota bacterium]
MGITMNGPGRVLRVAAYIALISIASHFEAALAGEGGEIVITGHLSDCQTGEPVSLAVIDLFETGATTLSGNDGSFEVVLPAGAALAHIAITHVSFEQIPFMELRADGPLDLAICLETKLYEISGIEVYAEVHPERMSVSPRIEMKADDLSSGTLSQADPLYALKDLPGVSSGADFDGRFSIYGSSPDANAFFLDGLYYSSPYHLGGLCSIYDPSNIKGFYFSPVPLSASSHGATGAVIEVETYDGAAEEEGNEFSLGLLSSSVASRRSFSEGAVTTSVLARRSYIDLLYDAFGGASNTQLPNFYDIQTNVVRRIGGRRYLKLGLLVSGDESRMSMEGSSAEGETASDVTWYRSISSMSLAYGYDRSKGAAWWGRAMIGYQPYRSNFDMSGNDLESMGWYGGRTTLRIDVGRSYGRGTISGGLYSSVSMIEYELDFGRGFWLASRNENSAVRLDNDGYAFVADGDNRWGYTGSYAEMTWACDRIAVQAGLRGEYYSRTDESSLSPRISLQGRIGEKTVVLASGGVFSRDGAEDFGNPASIGSHLKTEKAAQFNMSLRRELPGGVLVQAGGYLRSEWDLPVEADPVIHESMGKGRSRGLQIGMEFVSKGWETVMSYSYNRAERIDYPHTLTFRPDLSDGKVNGLVPAYDSPYWYASPYQQKHSLMIEAGRQMTEHFSLSLAWNIGSGRPYTPIGEVYQRDAGGYIASEGARMSATLPSFQRLDIHAEWRWESAALFVEVLNITNHTNVFNQRYNEDYSARTWFRGLPVMPAFGLRVSF